MTVIHHAVREMMFLLQAAAKNKSTVSYAEAWKLFDYVDAQSDRWDTISEAADRICEPYRANYGALMAAKESGLPGAAIYRFIQENRQEDYEALVGPVSVEELTDAQKKMLTELERRRVYSHSDF